MSSTRFMTVSYLPAKQTVPVPYLRLSGQWLQEAGFNAGDKVAVTVESGKLTITVKEK